MHPPSRNLDSASDLQAPQDPWPMAQMPNAHVMLTRYKLIDEIPGSHNSQVILWIKVHDMGQTRLNLGG